MAEINDNIQIEHVGYSVPCCEYDIEFCYFEKTDVPVLHSFVLRLIKNMGEADVKQIGSVFGLNKSELNYLIVDMHGAGWIELQGNIVSLSPGGAELFAAGDEQAPAVFKVESRNAPILFDLIGFKLASKSKRLLSSEDFQRAREVEETPHTAGRNKKEIVRTSFTASFNEYMTRIARKKGREKTISLYSIQEIKSSAYCSKLMDWDYSLSSAGGFRITSDSTGSNNENSILHNSELQAALTKTRKSMTTASDVLPNDVARIANDLSAIMGENPLKQYCQDGSLQINRMLTDINENGELSSDYTLLIGAPYCQHNRERIMNIAKDNINSYDHEAQGSNEPSMHRSSKEFVWLKPGSEFWGTTSHVNLLISDLEEVTQGLGKSTIYTANNYHQNVGSILKKSYSGVFSEGLIVDSGVFPPHIEVLLISNILACVFTRIHVGDGLDFMPPLPLGFMARNRAQIQIITDHFHSKIQFQEKNNSLVQIWPK